MDINKKKCSLNTNNTPSIKHDIAINVENEPGKWINFVSKQLLPFSLPFRNNNTSEKQNMYTQDTYLILGTQMMDKICTDSQITSCILSMPFTDIKMGTAYFNLANKYNEILLNTYSNIYLKQKGHLEILTASKDVIHFIKQKV